MLTIRLQRVGRTNDPSFRLVLIESKRAAKSGAFLEVLGSYDPRHKKNMKLEVERIKHWISKGATVSATVNNILVKEKITAKKTIAMVPVPKASAPNAATPAT